MSDLRKAAEMALEALENVYGKGERCEAAIKALREALDLETAIERGTKAWADVPNATEWVEELRGDDTPEVTPEVPCKTHPDAPHGFNRNASFDEDRYVCDCEFWEPVDNVDVLEERVHKTDKSIHEPVAIVNSGMGGIEWLTEQLPDDTPLYAAPYTKNDTTAGVLHKEWVGLTEDEFEKILETHNEATPFAVYLSIEAKLKQKNVPQP